MSVINIENLKKLEYHMISIVCSKCGHEYEKIFKEGESVEILKVLGLIRNTEVYHKIYNYF